MFQYTIETELLPLTAPELMEAQYFHALEAFKSSADVFNAFYVVVLIGQSSERQCMVECGLQRGTRDTLIDGWIARLDIE